MKYLNYALNSPTLTTWLSFLTKAINFTLIIPLLLKSFSAGDISIWYLYLGLINLLIILDAGFGSTFVRVISYGMIGIIDIDNESIGNEDNATGTPDISYLVTTYSVMKRFYSVLTLSSFVILSTIGTYVFSKPIESVSNTQTGWLCWWGIVITYPFLIWGNVYINVLLGSNNIPKLRLWESLFNICSVLTNFFIIINYRDVFLLIAFNQFWLLLSVVRNIFLVKNVFPRYNNDLYLPELATKIRKVVLPSAMKSGVGVFMSLGIIQGSGFVLARIVEPSVLAPYLFSLNIIQAIKSFAQAPFYSKIPLFSALMGKGDITSLFSISQKSMQKVYLIYTIAFFFLAFWGDMMFKFLKATINFPDKKLWVLFGIGFLIERFGAMHLQIYSTTNKIIWHKVNGITGLLMLLIGIVLFPLLGIISLPIALILGYSLFYSWYCPMLSYQLLKTTFWRFEKSSFVFYSILYIFYGLLIIIKEA